MEHRKRGVRAGRAKGQKQPVRQDGIRRASKYNNRVMKDDTIQVLQGFAKRLSQVRAAKGLSAREMSLSLGQGAGYINNIENGKNLPSMAMFFEICEYLDMTPSEFFDYPGLHEGKMQILLAAFEKLDPKAQELIIGITERLSKG